MNECGFCDETFDHDLRLMGERDGCRTLECRRCGAEIFEDDEPAGAASGGGAEEGR